VGGQNGVDVCVRNEGWDRIYASYL
jgi:hypothetical protein